MCLATALPRRLLQLRQSRAEQYVRFRAHLLNEESWNPWNLVSCFFVFAARPDMARRLDCHLGHMCVSLPMCELEELVAHSRCALCVSLLAQLLPPHLTRQGEFKFGCYLHVPFNSLPLTMAAVASSSMSAAVDLLYRPMEDISMRFPGMSGNLLLAQIFKAYKAGTNLLYILVRDCSVLGHAVVHCACCVGCLGLVASGRVS